MTISRATCCSTSSGQTSTETNGNVIVIPSTLLFSFRRTVAIRFLKSNLNGGGRVFMVFQLSSALCPTHNFVRCLRSEEIFSQPCVRHIRRDVLYDRSSAAKRVATSGRISLSGSQASQVR